MQAPRIPNSIMVCCFLMFSPALWLANASNAMIPPSPRLSARITNATYLTDTIMMSAQTISDNMPYILASVSGTGCVPTENTSLIVYKGLVPISPNTTPSAAKVSEESFALLPVGVDIKYELIMQERYYQST